MTLLTLLVVGLFVGMKHALESDHLAAIASLATHRRTLASNIRQGVAWGIGHAFTLTLIGGAVLALGMRVEDDVAYLLESCVGVMLVLLGADVLRKMRREKIHFHVHRHGDGPAHFHAHSHATEPGPHLPPHAFPDAPLLHIDAAHQSSPHRHDHAQRWPVRALMVGAMHGVAGSAALVLLSVEAAASAPLGLLYILVFGVGSIVGMALLSLAIAVPLRLSSRHVNRVYRGLTFTIAVITIGLGAFVAYSSASQAMLG